MSDHFHRGKVLFEQSRYEEAVGEFGAHLTAEPQDAHTHALLSISLASLKQFDVAIEHAHESIRLEPENGFAHYGRAFVELKRNRLIVAANAAEEALRCSPTDSTYHALLAVIHARKENWREALAAADQGLEHDLDDLECLNIRAMAQQYLGDKAAAAETIYDALAIDPNNDVTHANQGWALLLEGKSQRAVTHFRESLRLSPDSELARQGMIEALKSENAVYGMILRYWLWIGTYSTGTQFSISIALLAGMLFLEAFLGRAVPSLAPFMSLLMAAVGLALISTFFARPFFNFVLLFHPLGRRAMTGDQIAQGVLTAILAIAYILLNVWFHVITGLRWQSDAYLGLLVFAIPAMSIHECQRGWPRWAVVGLTFLAPVLFFLPVLMLPIVGSLAGWLPTRGALGLIYALALILSLMTICEKLEDVELVE